MPGKVLPRTGVSPPGALGYASYGMPQNILVPARRSGPALNPRATGYPAPGVLQPSGYPGLAPLPGGRYSGSRGQRPPTIPVGLTETGTRPRPKRRYVFTWPGGVLAGLPQRGAISASAANTVRPPGSAAGTNQQYQAGYMLSRPQFRLGPTPKLGPGSRLPNGQAFGTGLPPRTRQVSRKDFAAPAFVTQQYRPMWLNDYNPPNDQSRDLGMDPKSFKTLPPTIHQGVDGRDIVGTWTAHDFTPGRLFYKQGRSPAYWQDQSFGPDFRYLQPVQQVARYNLYTDIQLARQPNPNLYFLQYQTQQAVASQLAGANGMGQPLGYAAH